MLDSVISGLAMPLKRQKTDKGIVIDTYFLVPTQVYVTDVSINCKRKTVQFYRSKIKASKGHAWWYKSLTSNPHMNLVEVTHYE